jgi:hypothetical protein
MKKVKKMMFGGISKAAGKTLGQVSKMPGGVNKNTPPDVQKMMANLPRGSTVAGPGTGLAPKPTGIMGGIRGAVNQAVAQAPTPPPMAQKMMANLPRGSTVAGPSVGKSPLDGIKNLPKMSGPLGKAGTTGGQNLPPGMLGLGAALGKNPGINTTTTADMTRKSSAKPFSSIAGSLGMGLGKKMGMKKGGSVSSASKRADGCAVKGKTKGKMV